MVSSYDIIQGKIKDLKKLHSELVDYEDHHVFSFLCLKHFYYDIEEDFDVDECLEAIIDGASDGGIDAVLKEPLGGDMLLIQSKYYNNTPINSDSIISAIKKIEKTLRDIDNHKFSSYKPDLIKLISAVKGSMSDEDSQRIVFFTTQDPKTNRRRSKIEKEVKSAFPELAIDIRFGQDICKQIENTENAKTCVDYGSLSIDNRENILKYGESALLVNISAQSLQKLYCDHSIALFGLNLRYYVRNKSVDNGIDETISQTPSEFWYRNNGITIVCDSYERDGNELKLRNFSIINGGQTTYKIGRADIEKDFYLLCKVIVSKGETQEEQDEFVMKISQASNAQKPIKQSDLRANTPEQLALKRELMLKGIFYVTKRGEKANKRKYAPYQVTTIQKLGKLCLASLLQQPGIARNSPKAIFKDDTYDRIFRQPNTNTIEDLLRIEYYYETFKKKAKADKNVLSRLKTIIVHATTFQLACITLLFNIHQGKVTQQDLDIDNKDPDEIRKAIFKANKGSSHLFQNNLTEAEEFSYFQILFDIIAQDVLYEVFDLKTDNHSKDISVSNFFKVDKTYCETIIRWLLKQYNRQKFREALDKLCVLS